MNAAVCTRKPGTIAPRCQCPDCRALTARMAKAGRWGLRPVAPVAQAWDVLDDRVRRGWEDLAIASASGLSVRSVHAMLYRQRHGRQAGMTHATARALVSMGDPTAGRVGALSTTRRIRALARAGWSLNAVVAETGLPTMTVQHARVADVETVLASTWLAVRAAYRDLAARPGPSRAVAERAAAAGWEPPA
ncbi:MAG: hypothetical protein K0R97_1082, partial [Oerskovia sp.]|nr:hypothetical protein [Oerskovia sp.]